MKNPAVPKAFGTRYLIVRSYYFHIRSLTPQQAARNALAIRFNELLLPCASPRYYSGNYKYLKVVIPRLDRGIQKGLDAPIKSEHDIYMFT
jgi:hypothetical protein